MNVSRETRQVLEVKGRATIAEIAEALGIVEGDTRWHNIGQALAQGQGKWSQRVSRAEYVWLNGSRPSSAKTLPPTTSAELQPLIDNLGQPEFEMVGLTYVARTQDGAFICTDRHGVAWRVEVAVTAKLL